MLSFVYLNLAAAASVLALPPFVNEADAGLEGFLKAVGWAPGTKPPLRALQSLPDFDFAARQVLTDAEYGFYRMGAGQEWTYRHNLEVWGKVQFRPRFLRDVTSWEKNLGIEIFGYKFSAPVFIAPAAMGQLGDPVRAELNYMEAAGDENILYIPALIANKTIEELAAVKRNNTLNGPQVAFQQLYTNNNLNTTWDVVRRAEAAGAKALVLTVDSPGESVRIRYVRYVGDSGHGETRPNTWEVVSELKKRTKLPIILKGIQSVEDAQEAVRRGVDGIYISNHGGRRLEYAPAPIEVAYEIHRYAPEVFKKAVVLADSGVRSGSDVLKLLALGVKAVGFGRPFHFANVYGYDGIKKAINLITTEIVQDGWNLGANSISDLKPELLNLKTLENEARELRR